MINIATLVRQLTGRQLTEREIERAKRDEKIEPGHSGTSYYVDGENIIVEKTRVKYGATADSSYGWEQPHTGHYPVYQSKKVYTLEGLLKEKHIVKHRFSYADDDLTGSGPVQMDDFATVRKNVVYSPPGKLIGEKQRKQRD